MSKKAAAIIVAHPDDETLWAGGLILSNPAWQWCIITLCRGSDTDRAPRFKKALSQLGADGSMGDLDDGPDQLPLNENQITQTIICLLPDRHFDIIISHDPAGEYTRHLRHEEAANCVISLWCDGRLSADELWTFAYTDDNRRKFPEAIKNASLYLPLSEEIWLMKYSIITNTYGFAKGGFEAETTPRAEAFWQFRNKDAARERLYTQITLKTNI